ncbi:hypothetical protein [Kluyvera intermedia]|jgi:hypothetical protein|uniref:hypothetical protein n=1 Tax=Kluyvera intermedia TaxID=61648 RepID=UPI0035234241
MNTKTPVSRVIIKCPPAELMAKNASRKHIRTGVISTETETNSPGDEKNSFQY